MEMPATPVEHSEKNEKITWKEKFPIAVFGSRKDSDTLAVNNSDAVGRVLAEEGYPAANGGYDMGAMGGMARAYAETCRKAGVSDADIAAHLTGFVMPIGGIEKQFNEPTLRPRIQKATIVELIELEERQSALVNHARAYIATEGGDGTVSEVIDALKGEKEREQNSEDVPPRPVIIIDNQHLAIRTILEGEDSAKLQDLPKSTFYFISGTTTAEDGTAVPKSLQGDEHMTEQLKAILEYHYLIAQDKDEDKSRISELRDQLFSPESDLQVLTMEDIYEGK